MNRIHTLLPRTRGILLSHVEPLRLPGLVMPKNQASLTFMKAIRRSFDPF